jgi:hypothetical protein
MLGRLFARIKTAWAIDAHVRAVVREMLAENATAAEKPEAPTVTTFDFGDGNGPVPAHKHPNGGGWVADTATVDDTAYVGPDAKVYGNAWVSENASVSGDARVIK